MSTGTTQRVQLATAQRVQLVTAQRVQRPRWVVGDGEDVVKLYRNEVRKAGAQDEASWTVKSIPQVTDVVTGDEFEYAGHKHTPPPLKVVEMTFSGAAEALAAYPVRPRLRCGNNRSPLISQSSSCFLRKPKRLVSSSR